MDWFTVLVYCNVDGSKKFEPIFIGRAQHRRSFKKNYFYKYRLDYHFNTKARTTSHIFIEWLRWFDAYISKTPN